METDAISYYVLTATDTHRSLLTVPSGLSVAKTRLAAGRWPLSRSTRSKLRLRVGDHVAIYVAGSRETCRHVIARAVVASPARALTVSEGKFTWPLSVALDQVQLFPDPVPVEPLFDRMAVCRGTNPRRRRALFRSILNVGEHDFCLLTTLPQTS